MSLVATEQSVLKAIAELDKGTISQINRQTGLSFGYAEYICNYLVRKGYLKPVGHNTFCLAPEGKKILVSIGYGLGLDKETVRELASEVAKEVAREIKIKGGIRVFPGRAPEEERKPIQIKTDYNLPVEDESAGLESNIGKLGAKTEKEKSDIGKTVELFRKMQKKGKKR